MFCVHIFCRLYHLALYLSSVLPFCLYVHYCIILANFIQLVVYLLFVAFHYLIPEVVFYRYRGSNYVLLGSGYDVSSLHHSNLVISPTVVFRSMPSYWSVYPLSPLCIEPLQL